MSARPAAARPRGSRQSPWRPACFRDGGDRPRFDTATGVAAARRIEDDHVLGNMSHVQCSL
ncbi:hypothetical protein [Nannocystis pusilla]|uniref:Uncharacterized protein n=1 Tax=Nannocystis pusilla TaxID=889268 RepID=A0ABS7U261_9BACT|nr:hypothetical protein [Nannocystis pusilla]MBZ5714543.1 hypothetical protein [Nannocystis pusilla]